MAQRAPSPPPKKTSLKYFFVERRVQTKDRTAQLSSMWEQCGGCDKEKKRSKWS